MRIATASLRTGLAMTGSFTWGAMQFRRATARVAPTDGYKGYGATPPCILTFNSIFIFLGKGGTIGVYFYWEMNV